MKQSKLEVYVEILKALNQEQSDNNSTIVLSNNTIDIKKFKERIDFLVRQRLITKRVSGQRVFYENTEKGKNVLRYFNGFDSSNFLEEVRIRVANAGNLS